MDPEPTFLLSVSTDFWIVISLVSLFILLIFSALISGAEVAFFSLSKIDLKEPEKKNNAHKVVVALLENPQKLLATILISNNFINILIVLIFAYIGEHYFVTIENSVLRFIIEVVLVTFLILLFGEVLPKIYATRNAMKFAFFMAYPLKILTSLLSPLSGTMIFGTRFIENNLGKKKSNLSVEKLSQALELTTSEGAAQEDHKILEGIVSFGNTETSQIMTPRIDIFAIDYEDTYENVLSNITKKGYSRNPVYKENVDEIVGILYAKDLLPHLNKKNFKWQTLIREPYFVPENKKLDDLLKEFQEKKNHLAIVVDEYGGTSGIVTLEDVIEEIVGDISDEYDDEDESFVKINNTTFLFEGKTNLKDFYKILEIENQDEFDDVKGESETVAGFILEICGKFPKKGQTIKFAHLSFDIEQMDSKRIKKIKVRIEK